jgi:hypothetical protein
LQVLDHTLTLTELADLPLPNHPGPGQVGNTLRAEPAPSPTTTRLGSRRRAGNGESARGADLQKQQSTLSWEEKQTAVDILFEDIEASLKQTAPFTWLLGKRPHFFGTWVEKSLEQNSTCNKSSPPRKRRPSNQKKRRSASSDDDNDNTNNETATTTTAPGYSS